LKSRAHRNEEATSIVLAFEADDQIGFSTHEQSPYDPRRFVSLCHRDEPCGPAFEQAFEPASLGCGFASRLPDHRGCTQHEQSAQVAITLFGDPTLALFAAAAVLSGPSIGPTMPRDH